MIIGFLAFLACILTPVVLYIKRRQWTGRKKKVVFSLVAAFLAFPVLVPAGTIAAMPAPNVIFLIFGIAGWYFKTFVFCAVSYLITAVIFGLISQMIFFERKQD